MNIFPTKNQLIKTFSSFSNWEDKYMYIMDLGSLLPKFPKNYRTNEYLIPECQNYTWIVVIQCFIENSKTNKIQFYGDSDSAIIKGIIVIIFGLYQDLDIKSIVNFNINSVLNQLQLVQHLTISRSQGIYSILNSIKNQINELLINVKSIK